MRKEGETKAQIGVWIQIDSKQLHFLYHSPGNVFLMGAQAEIYILTVIWNGADQEKWEWLLPHLVMESTEPWQPADWTHPGQRPAQAHHTYWIYWHEPPLLALVSAVINSAPRWVTVIVILLLCKYLQFVIVWVNTAVVASSEDVGAWSIPAAVLLSQSLEVLKQNKRKFNLCHDQPMYHGTAGGAGQIPVTGNLSSLHSAV